jgi:hypothetical protein
VKIAPRGWLGRRGPRVVSLDDGDSRLVFAARHVLVQWYPTRRYTAWWVRGIALTIRVARLQVQWL